MKKKCCSKQSILLWISYLLIVFLSISIDYILHITGCHFVGRYLGIGGALLILFSFIYSLRKRNILKVGSPKVLLYLHEIFGWTGAFLILVHSGIHLNAILPWLAAISMMVVVLSGHVGKYLLRSEQIPMKKEHMKDPLTDKEKDLFFQSTQTGLMVRWRTIHIPFVMLFVTFALLHTLSIIVLWNG